MLVGGATERLYKWLHEQSPTWSAAPVGNGGAPLRRAAVIGADGFIGRRLVTALQTDGVATIGYARRHDVYWPDDPAEQPDVVFYLASSITPAVAEAHPEFVITDRLRFVALLAQLARSPKPPMVVLSSSGGTVYDPDVPGPHAETGATRATCRYGEAKLELEDLLHRYAGVVPGVILRLSNVYGVGQRVGKSQGVLAYWLNAAVFGGELHVIGDPSTSRDYVYVDDVVDCMRRLASPAALVHGDGPLVLNVGTGVSTSLTDLLDMVTTVVGHPLQVKRDPARPVDRLACSLDVRRAEEVLGWRARITPPEGIARMWRSLNEDLASLDTPSLAAPLTAAPSLAAPLPTMTPRVARFDAELRALAFSSAR